MSNDGWEDDEMADLFSFGNDDGTAPPEHQAEQTVPIKDASSRDKTQQDDEEARERANTDDSFLDLLEEADKGVTVTTSTSSEKAPLDDKETQEILNWLDEEETSGEDMFQLNGTEEAGESKTPSSIPTFDDEAPGEDGSKSKESEPESAESAPGDANTKKVDEDTGKAPDTASTEPSPTIVALPPEPAPSPAPAPPPAPPPAPKPIVFDSLEDALHHDKSTVEQIRSLFVQGGMKVDAEHRPQLWCRTICSGKTLDQVNESSVADSFLKWREQADGEKDDDAHTRWIREEAGLLAERIVACDPNRTLEDAKRDLSDVLLCHYQSSANQSSSHGEDNEEDKNVDPLLPPVACALLSAGVPAVAASVMLSNIMPAFMPLLALTQDERLEAAKSLHNQFYLLACYHLPLLVFHLDRYAPGWYWPKTLNDNGGASDESSSPTQRGRNLQAHGVVPQSWLISHLAGECGGTLMNPKWLLSLWDLILTSSNNSLRFFLSLAVLEKYSDHLLMLTGSKLVEELNRIMEFKEGITLEGFAIEGDEETSDSEAIDWVQDWCSRAQTLWESTPRTVVSRLRSAEDEVVRKTLTERQRVAEEKLKARLEAEAKAHREAVEAERERKAQEARQRLSRARLVAFYRKHAPDKEGNIDKILVTYEGRLDVLDNKLKAKYGSGFNPALKPKSMSKTTNKLLSTMNQGFARRSQVGMSQGVATQESSELIEAEKPTHVTVAVSATEVLPIICWSKEAAARKGSALARGRYSEERMPLKFYLIDSRPEKTVEEQGRFPTAVSMSPEALLDPDRMRQDEEMFESLRGAVHICVMGEGYSAVPALYGQKETDSLRELIEEDESRTSLCALFFVKKGFPFVSILEGGFVQAHSWLCREGPNRHLNASSVLVDYDPEHSLFGQMEAGYKLREELANAPARERASLIMQNFFDASMTSLTRNKYRMDTFASELETTEGRTKVRESVTESVSKFFSKNESQDAEAKPEADVPKKSEGAEGEMVDIEIEPEKPQEAPKGPIFRNPFAGRRSVAPEKAAASENAEVDDTAVDFAPIEGKFEKARPLPPPTTSPFARFTKMASKGDQDDVKRSSSLPQPNPKGPPIKRFSGIRSALSKSKTTTDSSSGEAKTSEVPKRKSFAGFGSKENGKADSSSEGDPKPNRFGGINVNQLRLSNLRGPRPAQDEVRAASDAPEVEESISFFANDSPTAQASNHSAATDESNESFLSAVSSEEENPPEESTEAESK